MSELRRNGMDRPPSPTKDEKPKKKFGESLEAELKRMAEEKARKTKNSLSSNLLIFFRKMLNFKVLNFLI